MIGHHMNHEMKVAYSLHVVLHSVSSNNYHQDEFMKINF